MPRRIDRKDLQADAAVERILARCQKDPAYFIFKWLKTRDEHDSKNPLKHLPDKFYLRHLLDFWLSHKLSYTAKSRQLMVSWLLATVALWTAKFRPVSLVLWQTKKLEDAAPFIFENSPMHARISAMDALLPDWMHTCYGINREGKPEWMPYTLEHICSYGKIAFPNGSTILGLAQGSAQVESKVPTLFIADEASLQPEWASAQNAAQPAIDGDARGITVGTMRLPSDYGEEIAPCDDTDPDAVARGVSYFTSVHGVAGIRVHYSADPAKDPATMEGAAWKGRQLASGYIGGEQGWRWQQHMEINPKSRAGTVVLPNFYADAPYIIIPDIPLSQQYRWNYDAGLDWGTRNHAVFHIYGMSPEGRRYLVFEISRPGNEMDGIKGFCQLIRAHPLFNKLQWIAADPSLWNNDQNLVGGLTSRAQIFINNNVFITKAKQKGQEADEVAEERLNNYYWKPSNDPLFQIFDSCTQTIRRFPQLMYEEWSEALAPEKSLKEKMRDLHTDEWDAFKYAESMWPTYPQYNPVIEPGTWAFRKRQDTARLKNQQNQRHGDLFKRR